MTESDEQMLVRFFEENRQEIADNGFTERVAKQLPSRNVKLNRIWTVICWIVGIAFFYFMDGWGQLRNVGILLLNDVLGMFNSVHLPMYSIIAILVLIFTMISVKMYNLAIE